MPNKNPFEMTNYCIKYSCFYPHNIAECLGISYKKACEYYREYRKNNKTSTNYIPATQFITWYCNRKFGNL